MDLPFPTDRRPKSLFAKDHDVYRAITGHTPNQKSKERQSDEENRDAAMCERSVACRYCGVRERHGRERSDKGVMNLIGQQSDQNLALRLVKRCVVASIGGIAIVGRRFRNHRVERPHIHPLGAQIVMSDARTIDGMRHQGRDCEHEEAEQGIFGKLVHGAIKFSLLKPDCSNSVKPQPVGMYFVISRAASLLLDLRPGFQTEAAPAA
ncbi:MAG: hypothetical protein J0H30_03745, partial [Alphaproteobacteria bacterium]|nr:hypothetical protein [Alphaproteobacteria bacterium]